jgi:hypothetical protein
MEQTVPRVTLLMAIIAVSCAPGYVQPVRSGAAHDLPLVQGVGYTGVIFPEAMAEQAVRSLGVSASRFWTPLPDDVVRAEFELRSALERASSAPELLDVYSTTPERRAFMSRTIAKILQQFPLYRRQYIGLLGPDGTRRVLLNCFPAAGAEPDFYSGWRQGVVAADDGWYRFWRIQYNVETGEYLELDSNGGA